MRIGQMREHVKSAHGMERDWKFWKVDALHEALHEVNDCEHAHDASGAVCVPESVAD